MRFLVVPFFVLFLTHCGAPAPGSAADPSAVSTDPATTRATPDPAPAIDSEDEQLAAIRADYLRIEAARAAADLKKDSLLYTCPDAMTEGSIYLYSEGPDVVLATHSYAAGDHGGTTEHYYFRDGQLFFYFQETGYWQFGGKMQTLPDGTEVPGTVDFVTEERRYYGNGQVVKALTKSYRYENGEDQASKADAATITTISVSGPPPGRALVDGAMAKQEVDCGLVAKLVER